MPVFRALTCVCLLSLIAGCVKPSTVTIYEQVYIPDAMLPGCPAVEWPGGTYREAGAVSAQRAAALKDCDDKFTAARKYQDDLRRKAKAAGKGV